MDDVARDEPEAAAESNEEPEAEDLDLGPEDVEDVKGGSFGGGGGAGRSISP
jgi:hypothetical protein